AARAGQERAARGQPSRGRPGGRGGGPGGDAHVRAEGAAAVSDEKTTPDDGGSGQDVERARTHLDVVEGRTGMFGAHGSGDTSGYGGLVRPVAMPGASSRPYGSWFDRAVDVLTEVLRAEGVDPAA